MLAAVVIVMGAALSQIPIQWLRLGVGALLLIFGLQWLKKALVRIANPRPSEEQQDSGGR